jgi:hypothetical protein
VLRQVSRSHTVRVIKSDRLWWVQSPNHPGKESRPSDGIGDVSLINLADNTADAIVSAFRDRGVPKPTSECRCVPQPRWVDARPSAKGGSEVAGDGHERGGNPAAFVFVPRLGRCACSRGLQASTREREASGPKRAPVPSSSPRGQPSLRGPWSFLL